MIEQQQILTTQNLATFFSVPEVRSQLMPHLPAVTESTFRWLTSELATRRIDRHSQLIAIKNAAYAWRQMMFYLSHLSSDEAEQFVRLADGLLAKHPHAFAKRFRPALVGLRNAVLGRAIDEQSGKRFLGWTTSGHWLLDLA